LTGFTGCTGWITDGAGITKRRSPISDGHFFPTQSILFILFILSKFSSSSGSFRTWAKEQFARGTRGSSACKEHALERFTHSHYHTLVGTQATI
jgi:hypothetical protein